MSRQSVLSFTPNKNKRPIQDDDDPSSDNKKRKIEPVDELTPEVLEKIERNRLEALARLQKSKGSKQTNQSLSLNHSPDPMKIDSKPSTPHMRTSESLDKFIRKDPVPVSNDNMINQQDNSDNESSRKRNPPFRHLPLASTNKSPLRSPLRKSSQKIDTPSSSKKSSGKDQRWEWMVNIRDQYGKSPDDPDYDCTTLFIPPKYFDSKNSQFECFTDTRKQYWSYKKKHFDQIVFIQIGSFFELYELDADIGEKLFDLKMTYRVNMRSVGVPMDKVEPWSSKLVAHGYKVAIMEQGDKSETNMTRVVRLVMTPGTLVDSILLTHEPVHLLSIKEDKDLLKYALCLVDCSLAEFTFAEFTDDKFRSKFETILVQTQPKELVFEKDNLSARTKEIIKRTLFNPLQNTRSSEEFWDGTNTLRHLCSADFFDTKINASETHI
eukprot:TRINITY_DN17433_c0_g1_i1.p2 TRINITY_DN17433_c0_g1~~TRINITY_DN17433_c0_g1_i1.p2  ORF type:complete len:437 (-),score=80.37 TRINITY_DN17433_c0_g1_i1:1922-3232(-)